MTPTTDAVSASALDRSALMHTYPEPPVTFVRGEGTLLWDTEGRRYLDFLGGLAVTSLGHSHPAVADALAERLGTDPAKDPYPLLLAMVAMGAMRAAMSFWATSGGVVPLEQLVDGASRALADGLPEDCALRSVIATAPGMSPAAVSGSEKRKDEE